MRQVPPGGYKLDRVLVVHNFILSTQLRRWADFLLWLAVVLKWYHDACNKYCKPVGMMQDENVDKYLSILQLKIAGNDWCNTCVDRCHVGDPLCGLCLGNDPKSPTWRCRVDAMPLVSTCQSAARGDCWGSTACKHTNRRKWSQVLRKSSNSCARQRAHFALAHMFGSASIHNSYILSRRFIAVISWKGPLYFWSYAFYVCNLVTETLLHVVACCKVAGKFAANMLG